MITLPNGCRCSTLSVIPRNWKSKSAPITKKWCVRYRFYPQGGKPKQIQVQGMNHLELLEERQLRTERILESELELLKNGYNPITKNINSPESENDTPFIYTLWQTVNKMTCVPGTKNDIKSIVRWTEKAAHELDISTIPISEVRRKHIKQILEYCEKHNPKFSAKRYNKYRAYLMKLFKELVEIEAVEFNPVRDISKKKETRVVRETLTHDQRAKIDQHLKNNHYPFWRFVQIFFHSGARETELMNIKKEDVDLKGQRFKVLIKKGREYRWTWRTIKDVAYILWSEIYKQAKAGEYLFSKGLIPGIKPIRTDQVGRRWSKHVKEHLGVTADLYSLKHLNTSETVDQLGEQDAAAMNAHRSTAMVVNVYDIGRGKRQHERLKGVNNSFS